VPRQNRVTPYGELIAVPDRGLFWGNRGALLDQHGNVARYSRGKAWLICVLEFKGRRRRVWTPGRLTELFFLDEATALAAGHRPCGECRAQSYRAFKAAWAWSFPADPRRAPAIDARLHADRLAAPGRKRTYVARLDRLPVGTMVEWAGKPWLVNSGLHAWTPGGYGEIRRPPGSTEVTVLTPRSTVAVLAAGYRAALHPSALSEALVRN
jgi:hypothetical protein